MANELYKELHASGVISPPYATPTLGQVEQLRDLCSVAAPELTPGALREGSLTIRLYNGVFFIWDDFGFICQTMAIEALMILLSANSRPSSSARAFLFPEEKVKRDAAVFAAKHRAAALRDAMIARGSEPVDNAQGIGVPIHVTDSNNIGE